MFTINARTDAQQCEAHAFACISYSREALAVGDVSEAERQMHAAENWARRARECA